MGAPVGNGDCTPVALRWNWAQGDNGKVCAHNGHRDRVRHDTVHDNLQAPNQPTIEVHLDNQLCHRRTMKTICLNRTCTRPFNHSTSNGSNYKLRSEQFLGH